MDNSHIVLQIIEAAKRRHMTQKTLASRAGITPETLSRIKKQGNPTLDILQNLAQAVELNVGIISSENKSLMPTAKNISKFRDKHRALVWSNPAAPDQTFLQRALLAPRFTVLLDAAVEFGMDRLDGEWSYLQSQGGPEVTKAARLTERILTNIRHGYQQAST